MWERGHDPRGTGPSEPISARWQILEDAAPGSSDVLPEEVFSQFAGKVARGPPTRRAHPDHDHGNVIRARKNWRGFATSAVELRKVTVSNRPKASGTAAPT